jgi:hypothetical protein
MKKSNNILYKVSYLSKGFLSTLLIIGSFIVISFIYDKVDSSLDIKQHDAIVKS